MPISKRKQPLGESAPRWWKFDRYEIENGYIRPAANASLGEFDPWLAHKAREGHIDFPPYTELANLVRDLPRGPFGFQIPDSEELRNGVLDWCRRYGLLGLLPHEVSSARFGTWMVTRTSTGWTQSRYPWEPGEPGPPWGEVIGESVTGDRLYETEQFWYDYFPDEKHDRKSDPEGDRRFDRNDDKRSRCIPLTEPFWQSYAEPLQYFVQVARFFANALEVTAIPDGPPVIEREVPLDRTAAVARLNHLSSVVTPIVTVSGGGSYEQEWQAPSMLGHLAMQASQNLLGDRKIISCDACQALFSSAHHSARFCSDLCGNRQRKRDQRKRDKRKKTARRPQRNKKR